MKQKNITKQEAEKILNNINEKLTFFRLIEDETSFNNPSYFLNNYILKQVNKKWPDKSLAEVSAIKYAKKIGVPVPNILYYDDDIILMEKAKGQRLDQIWKIIDGKERIRYMKNMINIVENMQKHKSKRIGSLFNKKIGKCIDIQKGPYDSFKEFYLSDYEIKVNRLDHPLKTSLQKQISVIKSKLHFEPSITFSHQDLELKNIFGENGEITCIIDWEVAGYYPAIYDYRELANWCSKEVLEKSSLKRNYPQYFIDYLSLSNNIVCLTHYKEWNIKDEETFKNKTESNIIKLLEKLK